MTEDGRIICESCLEENYFECEDCGSLCKYDDGLETVNGWVCEDCMENYFECYECGEWYPNDDACRRTNGEYICENCARVWYEQCEDCGDWFSDMDATYVEDYGFVCEDCLERFYYCDDCGRWFSEYDWNYDLDCCNECAESRPPRLIKPYHYHKSEPLTFYGDAKNSIINGHVGLEWELDYNDDAEELAEAINDVLGDRVFFEADCSITGCECIFHPHTYEELKYNPDVKKAFETASDMGAYTTNAGLHVHISRGAFGKTPEEQIENIAKICVLHNDPKAYEKLVKLARRTDRQAESWARGFSWDKSVEVSNAKDYVKDRCGSHGVAINCENRNTVEFRLGAGTVDYNEMIAWVDIVVMLVKKSREISFEDASNFDIWFEDAHNAIKEYMNSVGVVWAEPLKMTADDYKQVIEALMNRVNVIVENSGGVQLDYNTLLMMTEGIDERTRRALGYA